MQDIEKEANTYYKYFNEAKKRVIAEILDKNIIKIEKEIEAFEEKEENLEKVAIRTGMVGILQGLIDHLNIVD